MGKCEHPVDIGLRVYSDDTDWYVAYSADDAWQLRDELCGNSEGEVNEFVAMPDEVVMSIMDEDHSPESAVKKTRAEWVVHNGRGFLCSTEF